MTTRRRIALILGVLVAASILSAILDSAASQYLHQFNESRQVNLAIAQESAASYRRPIVVGVPLEENAATRYRSAFTNLESLPHDTSRQLGALVNQGTALDISTAQSFLAAQCGEVQSREFRDALRCTRCDWQLPRQGQGTGLAALFLGNCLVLSGHFSGSLREWHQSAQSYVEALGFACDLAQGDFSAGLVGIAVATSALRGLADLVASAGDDASFLRHLSQLLSSELRDRLPSMSNGIRSLKASLAAELIAEAQATAQSVNRVGVVVPGTALAGWRLRRHEAVLDRLDDVAEGGEAERRAKLAREIRAYAYSSGSEAFKRMPTVVPEAILSAESVALQYGLVRAQILVHEWRLGHDVFPTDVADLPALLDNSNLEYQPIDNGKSYRIIVKRGHRADEVLFTHRPGTEH